MRSSLQTGRTTVRLLLVAALLGAAGAAGAQDGAPIPFFQPDPSGPEVTLTAHFVATGETRVLPGRELLSGSREVYLRSAAVAALFNGGRYWNGALRQLDLKVGEATFRVTADSRLVQAPDGHVLLPVPVLDHGGEVWLPLTMLLDVIGPALGDRIAWDPETSRLRLGVAEYTVLRLWTEVLGRATAVHVSCRDPLGYRVHSPRPGIVELKIYGGEVNTGGVAQARRRGLLLSARSRQQRDDAVVTLRVDDLVSRYRSYAADEGREIVIVLEEEQVSSLPSPVPRGEARVNIDEGPRDVTHEMRLRTVVIDPGHGGHDVGAVGRLGILEKDVNLDVARELRRFLRRESDLEVVLTRERDEHVELADRAEVANRADGDLFLSLHCNSWFNEGARGLETYFLSPARSDWAKSVEATENAAHGEPEDVEFIVWELVQNRFIASSSRLAEIIQTDVSADLGLPDRGVRQAGFRVLVGAYMPAALIELGFLSHPQEERRLGESDYQRRLAAAIGRALLNYRDSLAPAGDLPVVDDPGFDDSDDQDGGY
ncbi:MAG: hypothetical protein GY838_18805 [bacterium]|nr:hypothetical protein [bacterium]